MSSPEYAYIPQKEFDHLEKIRMGVNGFVPEKKVPVSLVHVPGQCPGSVK